MNKIYHYELRRAVWNKFYLLLLVIGVFFARQVLAGEILLGIDHTAPFSVTSYRYYVVQLIPFATIALLFLLRLEFTKQTQRVKILTDVTPVNKRTYQGVRCLSILTGWWGLMIVLLFAGLFFLNNLFPGSVNFLLLFGVGVLVLLPVMIIATLVGLCLGTGYLKLSRRNSVL